MIKIYLDGITNVHTRWKLNPRIRMRLYDRNSHVPRSAKYYPTGKSSTGIVPIIDSVDGNLWYGDSHFITNLIEF